MNREQMEKVWPGCGLCKGASIVSGTAYSYGKMDAEHSFSVSYSDEGCDCDFPHCPLCGRPLTPSAWTDMEKRLEGATMEKTLIKTLSPGARFEWQGMMWTVISHDGRGTVILGNEELPLKEIRKLRREADDGREV